MADFIEQLHDHYGYVSGSVPYLKLPDTTDGALLALAHKELVAARAEIVDKARAIDRLLEANTKLRREHRSMSKGAQTNARIANNQAAEISGLRGELERARNFHKLAIADKQLLIKENSKLLDRIINLQSQLPDA